jgi:hypothetical protein
MYYDGSKYVTATNDPPPGQWVRRDYLDVVDFSDPAEPVVRKPVNIPGALLGLDQGGELIYTRGYDLRSEEKISAASYDGVQAHLIDEIPLGGSWPRPAQANGSIVYLGVPGTNNIGGTLEGWTLEGGKFARSFALPLAEPAQEMALLGDLLAVRSSQIVLFDAQTPFRLSEIGAGQPNACYGVQLSAADGSVERGLWVPMGWYGVVHIPARPGGTGE